MNNNKPQKAIVATVKLGSLSFEGLMLPDGSYAIATAQVARLISASPQHITKSLKRALGVESHLPRVKTELANNPATIISLDQFSKAMFRLAMNGNKNAEYISEMLVGLSLRQLFADAFGEKFEQEERQDWLIKRQATKVTFRDMTDSLKDWGFTDNKDYGKFVAILQNKLGIPKGARDIQDLETLNNLEIAQAKLATYIECGKTPWEALSLMKIN